MENLIFCAVVRVYGDTSTFQRVNIEDGKDLEHLIHIEERLLKNLKDQGEISLKEKNDLCPSDSKPRVIYGITKIHKALFHPFFPILSPIGTPNYNLVKFATDYLKV